ncbi:MAG: hypothetical protein KatS3mg111_2545 [Pirellulaceae bacterium]|nr:MAG: hypothetical protein KatS3mg111_2545 [Pirellulaceae bacterium]
MASSPLEGLARRQLGTGKEQSDTPGEGEFEVQGSTSDARYQREWWSSSTDGFSSTVLAFFWEFERSE